MPAFFGEKAPIAQVRRAQVRYGIMRSSQFQGENGKPASSKTPDGELLSLWIESADGAASATLYERYKQMVLAVCQGILHHRQDAEGAFQETFLVLTLKKAEIEAEESIKNWLYATAYLVAKNFRRSRMRRQTYENDYREQQSAQSAEPINEAALHELESMVKEAVQFLPEKHRLPFILHCMEEKCKREVAQELGLPEGTVATRVSKARKLLQQQLECRGVTPPGK